MKTTRGNTVGALVVLAVGLCVVVSAQQSSSSKAGTRAKNTVHEIILPQYPVETPAGPNLAVYQQHCLLCHSSRYVTMQPRFSRTVWEKEVKKMVDVYGAPITPPEQTQIVEYLTAIKGLAESK